jgi:2,5-dihydroxypyridine 5,6-dioxygenase
MERYFGELLQSVKEAVRLCKVQANEKVVIFNETSKNPAVVDAFYAAAVSIGADPVLVTVNSRPTILIDPPEQAVAALVGADIVFDLATNPWLYTKSTNRILSSGTRMLQVFTSDDTLISRPPTEQILQRERAARKVLEGCKTFRIFSDQGTDLVMERGERPIHTQGGTVDHPGDWDSYGVCLAAFAPLEDKANGKIVFTGTLHIAPQEMVVTTPIEAYVQDGCLVDIKTDHSEAKQFVDWLEAWHDPNSYVIAHTGFGLDHRAKMFPPDPGTLESIYAGVNVAFGANNIPQLGGRTACKSHMDAILFGVSVQVDDKLIIDRGEFTVTSQIQ